MSDASRADLASPPRSSARERRRRSPSFARDENASTGAPVDVAALPSYVASVGFHLNNYESLTTVCLGANATDAAFLRDPRGAPFGGDRAATSHDADRRLGYASAGGDGSQGVVVDVNLTRAAAGDATGGAAAVERTVSLYVTSARQGGGVDAYQRFGATGGGASMAVRVMDLETGNPIAPEVMAMAMVISMSISTSTATSMCLSM